MSNVNMEGLPPEMQARIQQIIEGAKQKAVANTQPQPETPHQAAIAPPPPKVPNLMDHTIALRQEVAALRQELHAMAQVTDAVGQAVGQLYATFQQQTTVTNQSPTYSESFQNSVDDADY